jgi:Mannosyltransferase (PIG-V)
MRTLDRKAIVVFALSRFLILIVALALIARTDRTLEGILSRWDGGWYLSIVRDGYPDFVPTGLGIEGQSSIAFFPGFPMLVRAIPLGPAWFGGALVSNLSSVVLVLVLVRLSQRLGRSEDTPLRVVILFSFLPASFVLSMVYAEALFLLFAALSLLLLFDRRWELAGLSAAAAGFTRPVGIVLVGSCLAAAVVAGSRHGEWRALIAPALAPIGTLLYFVYLRFRTGDALAYFHVEARGWGERFDFGVSNAQAVWRHLSQFNVTFFVAVVSFIALLLGVGLWLLVRWNPPPYVTAYVLAVVALAALTSRPTSVPRIVLSAFPMLIPFVERFPRLPYLVLVIVSAALMIALFTVTSVSETLSP